MTFKRDEWHRGASMADVAVCGGEGRGRGIPGKATASAKARRRG